MIQNCLLNTPVILENKSYLVTEKGQTTLGLSDKTLDFLSLHPNSYWNNSNNMSLDGDSRNPNPALVRKKLKFEF